VYIPFEGGIIY